ncbi:MAG TPA: glutamate--tRNA ligase, partial [Phnomibacter sp.]|nr:glutamate--tRNA ligase [Phnomibacter sp.]
MSNVVRVRFAPSPTGGLHLGGVRTVLYNYLFAKKHNGRFILRIEDTDQSRYVPGAEEYIYECLSWCGLLPDESPLLGGSFAPYRQSERKEIYHQYAHWLVDNGFAYYAFDTPEQLEAMRESLKTPENPSPTYNQQTRGQMRNSLSMEVEEARELIADGTPYVVRIKMPENETIGFTDLIRGQVQFNTSQVDDKVLLKADGMPTYHLAVVVDDYLMQITHAFRGEEWLSSAPVHIRLWQCLGWEAHMPQWAHLPLIMGPDGAKLSKRHGNKYGFPIFAMNWNDTNQPTEAASLGFRERGFLPQAFVNLLAMLGWNDGTGQEIFTLEQLIEAFDLSRVHSAGAQFDYEKAKWYNHEWIKRSTAESLLPQVLEILKQAGIEADHNDKLAQAITMVKDRCTLLTDFTEQMGFLYKA